jgi:hypothetical protein
VAGFNRISPAFWRQDSDRLDSWAEIIFYDAIELSRSDEGAVLV